MKRIIMLLVIIVVALAGCQNDDDVYINLLSSPIESMDTAQTSSESSFLLISDIYVGLTRINGENELVNSGAKDINISDDGLVYTITLRDDINWVDNNGNVMQALTAEDYVYTYTRMVDPDVASIYSYIFECIKNASAISTGQMAPQELGVRAIDDYTLEITLETPIPYFTNLLAFGSFAALPKAAVEKYGEEYGTSASTTWYDGAYYVSEYDPQYVVSLRKNPNYYNADNVQVENIDYRLNPDDTASYNAFVNDEADYTKISSVENYKAGVEAGIINEQTTLMTSYFVLNTAPDAISSNLNLRKAIQLGFDRESIVNSVYEGINQPIEYIIPYNTTTSIENGLEYRDIAGDLNVSYDEQKAQQYFDLYMEDMGYETRAQIRLEYLVNADSPNSVNFAEVIQAFYKEQYGITIELVNTSGTDYNQRKKDGSFDIISSSWAPDYADPSTYLALWTSANIGSMNTAQYDNQKYNELFEQARLTSDLQTRYELFAKCEQMLIDDAVLVPQYQIGNPYLIDSKYNYPEYVLFLVSHEYLTKTEDN